MTVPVDENMDFKQNAVRNFVHDNQNSAPATPAEGQEYFNSSTKKKQYWNGSKWVVDLEVATDAQVTAGTAEDVAVNPKQLATGLSGKQNSLGYTPENSSNKVTSFGSTPSDSKYPSEKLTYDQLATKAPLASPAFTGNPTAPTQTAGDNSTKIATTAFVTTAITAAMTGGLVYKGSWDTSNATDYSALNTYRPISKGWMFKCSGTGCTIDSVNYNSGDLIIFNRDVAASTTITTVAIDHYDHTQSEDTVLLDATQTLTNKTISGANNTISNLALSMFASGVILTALSNNPSDTALLTEKATKALLDLKAPLASPALTGTPTAPTPTTGDNSTKIATTAFVKTAVDNIQSGTAKIETYNNPSLTPTDGKCTWSITHTLGTSNVVGTVYEVSTGKECPIMNKQKTSDTTFTVKFNAASSVAANTYQIILMGVIS